MSRTMVHRRRRRFVVVTAALGVVAGLALMPMAVGEASEPCTNASLSGEYGFKGSGAVVLPNGTEAPVAVVGRTVSDGRGGLRGADTSSFNGTITRETSTGTYQVRSDCTGSETFKDSPSGMVVNADLVVVDNGRQVLFIETDPGTVLSVSAERQ